MSHLLRHTQANAAAPRRHTPAYTRPSHLSGEDFWGTSMVIALFHICPGVVFKRGAHLTVRGGADDMLDCCRMLTTHGTKCCQEKWLSEYHMTVGTSLQ